MKAIPNTPITEKTLPADLERIRRDMAEAIRELQLSPLASGKLIADVSLSSGIATPIPHGLGRRARVFVSPSSAVTIEETDGTNNPATFVTLTASADVVVDLIVVPA
jgi:hypothetical protein